MYIMYLCEKACKYVGMTWYRLECTLFFIRNTLNACELGLVENKSNGKDYSVKFQMLVDFIYQSTKTHKEKSRSITNMSERGYIRTAL